MRNEVFWTAATQAMEPASLQAVFLVKDLPTIRGWAKALFEHSQRQLHKAGRGNLPSPQYFLYIPSMTLGFG